MNPVLKSDTAATPGHTYAEPLAGLRVSWGAVVSGALAALAISFLLWGVSVAIILTATDATMASLRGSLLAMWICAMATTLIGAFCGGALAGYLPGSRSKMIAGTHGFLAWALAFVVSAFVQTAMIGSIARQMTSAALQTATAAAQTAGAAAGGVASSGVPLDQRFRNLLTSLGYSQAEASSMVSNAKGQVQHMLQRGWGGMGERPRGAFDTLIDWSAGLTWSFYGTWLVAAALAVGGGIAAIGYMRRRHDAELAPAPGEHEVHVAPASPSLTPAE